MKIHPLARSRAGWSASSGPGEGARRKTRSRNGRSVRLVETAREGVNVRARTSERARVEVEVERGARRRRVSDVCS